MCLSALCWTFEWNLLGTWKSLSPPPPSIPLSHACFLFTGSSMNSGYLDLSGLLVPSLQGVHLALPGILLSVLCIENSHKAVTWGKYRAHFICSYFSGIHALHRFMFITLSQFFSCFWWKVKCGPCYSILVESRHLIDLAHLMFFYFFNI